MPVAAAPPAPDRGDAPTVQGRLPAVLLMAGSCLLTVFGAVVLHPVPVEPAFLLDDPGVDSTGVIGVVTAVAGTATVLGSVLFTRLPDRPRRRLPALFLLCAVGFLVMGLADSLPLPIAGAVVNCVGTGLLLPSLLTPAMSRLDFADRGPRESRQVHAGPWFNGPVGPWCCRAPPVAASSSSAWPGPAGLPRVR
ncbi:hypothetical protein [Streptomyces sp. NPDC058625]|uniref:hypothetical protein n=1 Tax=Streptomyces sp. NPDC058625 TaxID=3346564 RepID=UPI00365F6B4B